MRRIHVTVNNYRVTLTMDRMAGSEIKQEAAAQGAELQVGFRLSVGTDGRYRAVDDEDVVAIHDGQEFLAVAADCNS